MTELEKTHAVRRAINLEGSSWPESIINAITPRSHDTVNGQAFEEFGPEQVRDEYLQKLEYFKTLAKELGAEISEGTEGYCITIDKPRLR
jgi:hypothetical protein